MIQVPVPSYTPTQQRQAIKAFEHGFCGLRNLCTANNIDRPLSHGLGDDFEICSSIHKSLTFVHHFASSDAKINTACNKCLIGDHSLVDFYSNIDTDDIPLLRERWLKLYQQHINHDLHVKAATEMNKQQWTLAADIVRTEIQEREAFYFYFFTVYIHAYFVRSQLRHEKNSQLPARQTVFHQMNTDIIRRKSKGQHQLCLIHEAKMGDMIPHRSITRYNVECGVCLSNETKNKYTANSERFKNLNILSNTRFDNTTGIVKSAIRLNPPSSTTSALYTNTFVDQERKQQF